MAVSGSSGGGGSGGIRAGRAFVELFTKDNAVYRGLATLQKRLSSLGSFSRAVGVGMLGAGASVLGGVLALFDRVSKNGKGLTGKEQRQLAFAGDAVREAWEGVETIFGRIVAALIPTREEIAAVYSVVAANLATVRRFIDNNRALVRGVVIGAAALSVGGLALIAFGTAASAAATAIGVAVAVVKGLAVAVGVLTSPLGLAAVALGALGYLFVTQTEKGKKWAADTGDYFREVKGTAVEAWEGISAAIAKGDLEGAAKVALAALNLEFRRAMVLLQDRWNEFKSTFVDRAHEAVTGAKLIWNDFSSWLSKLMADLAVRVSDSLVTALGAIQVGLQRIANTKLGKQIPGIAELSYALAGISARAGQFKDDMAGARGELEKMQEERRKEILADHGKAQGERDKFRADEMKKRLEELDKAEQEFAKAVAEAKKNAAQVPDPTPGVRAAASTLGAYSGPFAQQFNQGNAFQEKVLGQGQQQIDINLKMNNALEKIQANTEGRAVFA